MFSGGLDTSIIAHVMARNSKPKCFTVFFPLGDAPDIPYARYISRRLGLDWELLKLSPNLLPKRLADVVEILETFDPMEVRNSLTVYHAMRTAKDQGFSKPVTGDAADELFAGYSFSFNLPPRELTKKLRDLRRVMHFSSRPMAASLRLEASLPYLDPSVVRLARRLGPRSLVGVRKGKKYGKLVLRLAFEDTIGKRSAWRKKTPIEYGSGTTTLPRYYEAKVTDHAFAEGRKLAAKEGVTIRDKEHLEYYRLYRVRFPPPSVRAVTRARCPSCGGDVRPASKFCIICGAYPVVPTTPK